MLIYEDSAKISEYLNLRNDLHSPYRVRKGFRGKRSPRFKIEVVFSLKDRIQRSLRDEIVVSEHLLNKDEQQFDYSYKKQ